MSHLRRRFFIKIYGQIKTTITSVIINPDRFLFFLSLFPRLPSTSDNDYPLRQLMEILR